MLSRRGHVLPALSVLLACVLISGCSFLKSGANSPETLPPIAEEKVCGVVPNKTLRERLSLEVVKYHYDNSSSGESFSCMLLVNTRGGVSHVMTIEYQPEKATQLSDITDRYRSFSPLSIKGKEGGSGWVKDDYTNLFWLYPNDHLLVLYVFEERFGDEGISGNLKAGLPGFFEELINDIPSYNREAGSIPFTSVPSKDAT